MTILIGGVLANQRGVWEGWNTVCALFSYALCSVMSSLHIGTRLVVMSVKDELICVRLVMPCCMFSMQLFLSEIVTFRFE